MNTRSWWNNLNKTHLFAHRALGHQLTRQLVFVISHPRICAFPHQQLHGFHLMFVVLQRAEDVKGRVSTERLKTKHKRLTIIALPPFFTL